MHELKCTAFTAKKNRVYQVRWIKSADTASLQFYLLGHALSQWLQQWRRKSVNESVNAQVLLVFDVL